MVPASWQPDMPPLLRNTPIQIPLKPTTLHPMGTSAVPLVHLLPGAVLDDIVPNDLPWAAYPATDIPGGVTTPHLVRHQDFRHVSTPSQTFLQSPLRHHRRTASVGRPPIRETLNACVTYDEEGDGVQGIRINQYVTFISCTCR